MAPQLYTTMYKEQFPPPGRARRAQPRPSSAHRRNNPQPRPDFLFPRSLQPNYKSTRPPPLPPPPPSPPVDPGRPLFPPVRRLSFHSPVTSGPDIHLKPAEAGKPHHMPPVNPIAEQALPPAGRLQKLLLPGPAAGTGTRTWTRTGTRLHVALDPRWKMDHQRNVLPLSAQHFRQHAAAELQRRPQTSSPPAAAEPQRRPQTSSPPAAQRLSQTQSHCSRSKTSLDYSGCYSCFHVVKPHQAGHYIIHPEFVSECFR